MAWSFVYTNNAFTPQGEILNAYGRKVSLGLSKLDSCSFKLRVDHQLANQMLVSGGWVKAYRDGTLRFFGPIVSAEEHGAAGEGTVQINAVGAGWYLTKREVGRSDTGTVISGLTDRAAIAELLITEANTAAETTIQNGAASAGEAITYTAGPYKPVMDCITELSTALNGFDWRIYPLENWNNASSTLVNNKAGEFRAAPLFGIQQDNAVFEFGTGRANVQDYTRLIDRQFQANYVYHKGQQGSTIVSANDPTSIANWWRLDTVVDADVNDTTARQALVDEHLRVRKNPREVINFTPLIDPEGMRLPKYGSEYDLGDEVRFRAYYDNVFRIDTYLRVHAIDFDLSDVDGTESQTLTVVDE